MSYVTQKSGLANIPVLVSEGGTGATTAEGARTNLGLEIGVDIQAYDSDLQAIAGLASNGVIVRTGDGTAQVYSPLPLSLGGLGFSTLAQGDILYAIAADTLARLAIDADGKVLQIVSGVPSWQTVAGTGDVTAASNIADNRIVRGDGGAKGIQQSGITINDTDEVTGVASLQMNSGAAIAEFSTDGTLGGNSDTAVPTEKAVKTYVDATASGDVVGPASSTDNAIARFDSTTGKLLQNSGVTVTDANNIATFDNLAFNTSPTPLTAEGSVYWDATDHTLALKNDEVDVTLQIGQEAYIRVYNDTGVLISNGSVVYASGAEVTEDRLTIALADASTGETSRVIGFATHDIEDATYGYVTQFGNVNGLDTSAFTVGDPVYLSTTAGEFTGTAPSSPNFSVFLGYVAKVNASTGRIFVTTIGNTSGANEAGASENVVLSCRKGSAGTITRGQAVYISGYNVGADEFEVELADANGTGTMPSVGLADASITNSASGNVVLSGRINDIDTSSFSVGDSLYISETAGALTTTRPTATTSEVQRIGTVARSNVSNGVVLVQGAGRTNDVPNESVGMTYDLSQNTLTGTTAEFNTALSDGSFATLAGTETLTNKTINTASNTLTIAGSDVSTGQVAVANGGTGQSSYTNGQLLIGNTTGNTLDKATLTGGTNLTVVNGGGSITLNVDDAFLLNTGDTGTGVYDFGGATSFEIPNSATPTVNADGEIAVDTTVTDFSHGVLKYYGGEEMGVVAMPIAQFTSPTDNYVVTYNATNDEFELQPGGGGGGFQSESRFSASSLRVNTTLNFAPIEYVDLGTIEDYFRAFDDTTQEYVIGTDVIPDDIDTTGNITIEVRGKRATGTASANTYWDFDYRLVADAESVDGSYTTSSSGAQAVDTTTANLDVFSWTVSASGFVGGDLMLFRISRDSADAGDTLSGDYYMLELRIIYPRA